MRGSKAETSSEQTMGCVRPRPQGLAVGTARSSPRLQVVIGFAHRATPSTAPKRLRSSLGSPDAMRVPRRGFSEAHPEGCAAGRELFSPSRAVKTEAIGGIIAGIARRAHSPSA